MSAKAGRGLFFRIRVAVLLGILFVVVLVAIRDFRSRQARKDWKTTLDVAVVLLRAGAVDDEAVDAVRARAPSLAGRLEGEMRRYRHPSGGVRPFAFHVLGPVDLPSPAPEPSGEGIVDLVRHSWAMNRWLADVDPRAGVEADRYDTRIYVIVRKPASDERSFIEGRSEENGRIGVVNVELDTSMADLLLVVTAHELMHTLGATDRYDSMGRTVIPAGLPEPDRVPLYPQRFAEIMARNRVLAPGREAVPESIDELAVGARTADEIGWTAAR